jgi:hypothetical protein
MRIFLILLLLPLQIFSQDLQGVWTGTIYNDSTKKYIPYELAITENNGKLSGYSHTVFTDENNRQETGVKSLKIKKKGDKILIEDEALIYNNYLTPPPKGVKQFSVLNFSDSPTGRQLVGVFNTNRTKEYASLTGTINLHKKEKITETSLIPVLEELKLSNSLSFVQAENEKKNIAVAAVKTRDVITRQQMDVALLSNPKKESVSVVRVEKDENLIDIDEDTVDYKVDVIENAEVNKVKIQKKETVKTPVITLPKTEPLPEPKKQTVNLLEVKKSPAAQTKTDVAVTTIKEEKKAQLPTQPKHTTVPVVQKIVTPQQDKKEVAKTNAEIKKDIPVTPKENKEKVIPPPSNPVQKQVTTTPVFSSVELAKRKIETIRSVDVKSDSIVLTLYDNGVIDGDTVSVILNGRTLMSKQRLTESALSKTLYMTPDLGDSLQLIMFAENLGSIAPNTGLLIIQDGADRHEVRFSGDLQKNSAIILRRKY